MSDNSDLPWPDDERWEDYDTEPLKSLSELLAAAVAADNARVVLDREITQAESRLAVAQADRRAAAEEATAAGFALWNAMQKAGVEALLGNGSIHYVTGRGELVERRLKPKGAK